MNEILFVYLGLALAIVLDLLTIAGRSALRNANLARVMQIRDEIGEHGRNLTNPGSDDPDGDGRMGVHDRVHVRPGAIDLKVHLELGRRARSGPFDASSGDGQLTISQ